MASVCEEYRALVDKAYNKFSRFKDFLPYGQNRWDFYFRKAFQVYTKLWKFQQENRQKLVEAGLKRWEIGEIASRIGQLYYIYYLRNSDAAFLKESYIFFEAILSREYFKEPGKDIALANKQLRYYARFIVICLLLNRWDMVNRLARQLHILVEEFSCSFQNSDVKEWKTVAQEIVRFLKADVSAEFTRPKRYIPSFDGQQSSLPSGLRSDGHKFLRLKNAVLVSYYHNEVKFNELTLDNFRMLQFLEWEPSGSYYRMKSLDSNPAAASLAQDIVDPTLPPNPQKTILYRPTIQQFLLVLATACEETTPDSVILLYISASGKTRVAHHASEKPMPAFRKSLSSTESSPDHHNVESLVEEMSIGSPRQQSSSTTSSGLWLGRRGSNIYPSDILPFTRRPLFIILDSDSSSLFESMCGDERGEPVSLLLSPTSSPSSTKLSSGLFTYFLTAPLPAFCQMTGVRISELQQGLYERTEKLVSSSLSKWGVVLAESSNLNIIWGRLLSDPFLRQLILRFIFARACYSLSRVYATKPEFQPSCSPPLPGELNSRSNQVEVTVQELAKLLGVLEQFKFSCS